MEDQQTNKNAQRKGKKGKNSSTTRGWKPGQPPEVPTWRGEEKYQLPSQLYNHTGSMTAARSCWSLGVSCCPGSPAALLHLSFEKKKKSKAKPFSLYMADLSVEMVLRKKTKLGNPWYCRRKSQTQTSIRDLETFFVEGL